MDCMSVLYAECVFAERPLRVRVDVAGRKVAFLGRLLRLYGSHHSWRSLVLAMRHCGCDDDITYVAPRDYRKGNLNITVGVDSATFITSRSASILSITLRAAARSLCEHFRRCMHRL